MPHFRETKYYWMVILQHKIQHKCKITQQSFCTSEFYQGEAAGKNTKDNWKGGVKREIP